MANKEHLNLLKQGVFAWNNWRKDTPTVIPDLEGADLSECSFMGRAQEGTMGQYFTPQDLKIWESLGLSMKRLHNPLYSPMYYNFKNVNFEFSNFQFTFFKWVDLRGATLDTADLTGACFDTVLLDNANLAGTLMRYTSFINADLSKVNLQGVAIASQSNSMDIDTLINSIGHIPDDLLLSFNVPDNFVNPALSFNRNFYSCFISYSNADLAFAKRLYSDLGNRGVRCWFAPSSLRTGERIRQKIEDSIHSYDKLLLILSKNSISSSWVEDEVETAIELEQKTGRQVLFPIRIDNSVMEAEQAWVALIKRKYQISDFSNSNEHFAYTTVLNRLLADLKKNE